MTSAAGSPGRSASPTSGVSLRDALIAIGVVIALLVLVELAVPSTSRASVAAIVDLVGVAAFSVTGLVAWHRRPHNATGRLMVATGVALWAASMQDDEIAVLRHAGELFDSLPLALLLHLLLAFPSGRLVGRASRVTVVAAYLVALVPPVVQDLIGPGSLAATIGWVQTTLGLTTLVATFVLASRRLARTTPVMRRQLLPFLGYGCLAVVLIGICIAITHTDVSDTVLEVVLVIQVALVSGIPIAFLVALTVGAFGRAGEVEEVARGISEASAEPGLLDDLMVRALGDRSARVLWSTGPEGHDFVDSDGSAYEVPEAGGWWPVGSPAPVGALRYDQTLIADTGVVATIAAPLELAIDNRRLVVDLRSAVQRLDEAAGEIRTSRRRIVVAADAERRRIARDLHDGAQQRIVLAGLEVQRIGRRAEDPEFVRTMATQVSEQIRSLLDELRGLVQGIMPTTLQELGLEAGVTALADQMPMPVRVRVAEPLGRMDAEVESTGYFVVAEALTNAVKHAAAQQITVDLNAKDGRLEIIVTDDGRGLADSTPGFGLSSLQDRVAALDGTITLLPAPSRGTTLRAEFVCG
jgi:signal transduction histidine kinase